MANEQKQSLYDSTSVFFQALHGTDELVTIQNDVAQLTLNTKGGTIYKSVLKDYMEQDKKTPITLFRGEDVNLNFLFYNQRETILTENYYFTPVDRTDSTVTMRLAADSASYIDFRYAMHPGSYLVDFSIQAVGMDGKLASTNKHVDIEWSQRARQLEKGYTYENRLAELTYKRAGEGTDNLSANGDDQEDVVEPVTWIAFKNQFFSSVLITDANFEKTSLSSKMEAKESGYIKDYAAEMNTAFDPTGQQPTQMYFYFGPNHYKTLSALDNDRVEDWDLNKLVYLYPTTWKTYMSSAKMRVLKPKIDEINQKYPKQEDAMKKQQEIMGLYSQYGVSPMGGCLPMLLQMPIIIALFMFIPSAIELRQQSFLWADDLSTYDAFIHFPFRIPFLGSHLSLFCVLMTVTQILNTKFMMQQQDTGANPQMAAMKWMSYLMPIMFLFILNEYPSGLNYYYFISTLVSVLTTIILRKTTNEEKLLAQLEANKKDPKQMRKTGFAARLEAMQKQAEEMQRQQQQQKQRK